MAKGLDSFDNFSWASLLKGREVLVCDNDRNRGMTYTDALEEAGARVTCVWDQPAAANRLRGRDYALALVTLRDEEEMAPQLAHAAAARRIAIVLVAAPTRHQALRSVHPAARIASPGMDARQLVMFLTGTADE